MNDAVTLRGDKISTLGRIDQYDLLGELGGGGFGSVYLAKDTVAGIEVAVKGLPPLIRNNAEELERIRENFALVSRLHHPYIAAALHLQLARDVYYSDDSVRQKLRVLPGDTLMVMEYAPGVTLSKWRKQFPGGIVPFEQAIPIVWQIAQALDYAHGLHIIHRDVKPSNIIVETKVDGDIAARLLDFGLAAEIRSSMGRISREICDKSGTRPYMAPEQWAGRKQGPATDQYALAVLLSELLTGEVPFASVFETGDPVVMMTAICNREVELPDDCPCQTALRRALAKDPSCRFANCVEFVEAAANNEQAAQPNEVAQIGDDDAEKNHKRSGLIVGGLVFAAIVVVGILGFAHRQQQQKNAGRDARIVAEGQSAAERREVERTADEDGKTDEQPKAQEEATLNTEAERKNRAEMTLQFISAYETKQYAVAAKLIGSIDSDSAEVQFDIAKMYENGWGVSKDEVEAARWYRKAAEQGYLKAQNNLGQAYRNGRGVRKDYAEAMFWFRKAAAQGDARAQFNIGCLHLNGEGVKKDYAEAMRWFRKAAEQGDPQAQFSVARMYFMGWAVTNDEREAVKWCRKAADQDYANAQYVLGLCYAEGNGVAKDSQEAANWYRKAAEQGCVDSQVALGLCYAEGNGIAKDPQEAANWYRKAAERGNAEAQALLGSLYLTGEGVAKDYREALKWYREAANQGNSASQCALGGMYCNGWGVAKDYREALKWFRKAAEQGYAEAQNNLGVMYGTGEGAAKDYSEAVKWYRKAAEQGNAGGQANLGAMYYNGWGVARDYREALNWYSKAAKQGNEEAKSALKRLGGG